MKKIALLSLAILALSTMGCSDADRAQFSSNGSAGDITCYSGGKVIYQGRSTGKIQTETDSDGWYFEESGTGKLIRVSGACVIKN
jgi:hypothetical protein